MTLPYQLGRRPSVAHERARNFLLAAYFERLPTAPAQVDYAAAVTDWPVYLNDQIGDCTAAGAGHLEEVWSAEVDGAPHEVTDDDVVRFYELQGYRPGEPDTDRGADMLSVLNAWRKEGIGGRKILAFAEVDAQNLDEVRAAAWLFSGLYVGCVITQASVDQFQAGKPWDAVDDEGQVLGGHCIVLVSYDSAGPTFVSWGRLQRATWAWWSAHVQTEEVYACIPADDQRLRGRALPNGFRLAQLQQDLAALGTASHRDVAHWLIYGSGHMPTGVRAWIEHALRPFHHGPSPSSTSGGVTISMSPGATSGTPQEHS